MTEYVSYHNATITYYKFRKELKRWTSFMVFDNHNDPVLEGFYDHRFKEMVTYGKNNRLQFWSMIDLVRCMNDVYKKGKIVFYNHPYLRSKRYAN